MVAESLVAAKGEGVEAERVGEEIEVLSAVADGVGSSQPEGVWSCH